MRVLFCCLLVFSLGVLTQAETLNSTSAPQPPTVQDSTITNCSAAYWGNEAISRLMCSISMARANPDCKGCGLNGTAKGTIAVMTPTTRPVAIDMRGLPLCPGAMGNTMSNSCSPSTPTSVVPATEHSKNIGKLSAPK